MYEDIASRPGVPEGEKGHAFYEDYRSLPKGDPARDPVAAESTAYYDAVRAAAAGGG